MLSRFSRVQLFVTLWTVARQAPLSTGFPRQEHWNGVPCPPPGDLPDPGIEPGSPALEADVLSSEPQIGKKWIYLDSERSTLQTVWAVAEGGEMWCG